MFRPEKAPEEFGPWLLCAQEGIDLGNQSTALRTLLCPPTLKEQLRSAFYVAFYCLERYPRLGYCEAHIRQRFEARRAYIGAHFVAAQTKRCSHFLLDRSAAEGAATYSFTPFY